MLPQNQGAYIQVKRASNWIYSIAAFSLVNAILDLTGAQWTFFIGLGITSLVDAFSSSAKIIGFVIDLIIAGFFALLGFFASKGKAWAFFVAMGCYFLDAGLFFLMISGGGTTVWLCIAFHIYVLVRIFPGITGSRAISGAQFNLQTPYQPPPNYGAPPASGWQQPPAQGSNWPQQPPAQGSNWPQQPPSQQSGWVQQPPPDED